MVQSNSMSTHDIKAQIDKSFNGIMQFLEKRVFQSKMTTSEQSSPM